MSPRGDLFLVSAPSGVGKTTLIERLFAGPFRGALDLAVSVSHTTRPPRSGEAQGREYHFVDVATFERMIAGQRFLEWARYQDNYYGTSLAEVEPRLAEGIDVILEIEVQGAAQVLTRHPEAHGVFILPPSFVELERRLVERGLDDSASMAGRLAVSIDEIKRYREYEYVIINDDLDRASTELAAILTDKRLRRRRVEEHVEGIVRGFEAAARPLTAPPQGRELPERDDGTHTGSDR
ncbi:MAG: guanylate kinase [Thermoanaerobaculia bacterium]